MNITELAGVGSAKEEIDDIASDAGYFSKLWLMLLICSGFIYLFVT
jgi:hypothetical protein